MPWNLVDSMSPSSGPRRFYLPLDGLSSDVTLDFAEDSAIDRVSDAVLTIKLGPPANGFPLDGDLPNASLRLHAVDRAQVWFKPAKDSMGDSLVLKCLTFSTSAFSAAFVTEFPSWWDRWRDARCIPLRIIYENVDSESVRAILESLEAPVDDKFQNRVPPKDGLSLPQGVFSGMSKVIFMDGFMRGEDGRFILAEAGSYMGAVAKDPSDTSPQISHILKLHVEYSDHSADNPHPMNPREFLYLLFGDSSQEALTHPLLRGLDAKGKSQPGHESKSMRLRPPFRTHARVMWEADLEAMDKAHPQNLRHSMDWTRLGSCKERLYNDHEREGRRFNRSAYNDCRDKKTQAVVGCWKCNLFVLDVAMRAGFRVPIHPVGSKVWHYIDPKWMANLVDRVPLERGGGIVDRIPLEGAIEGAPITWGFKIEGGLRGQQGATLDLDKIRAQLNTAMLVEGRCFILALDSEVGSGHMIIVDEVLKGGKAPLAMSTVGHGFAALSVRTREAVADGAFLYQRRGLAVGSYQIRLIHMIELQAGQDPDTPLGLRDCNVQV